jgi:hypothetical protein
MPNAPTTQNAKPAAASPTKTAQTPGYEGKTDTNAGKPGFENEGEGNKTAARNYNKATEEYSKSGRAETAASEAKKALDGPEADELKDAEEEGKRGEPTPEGP